MSAFQHLVWRFQQLSVSAFELGERNGAGKATLLKLLNAPFMPQEHPVGLTHRPRTSMF